MSIKISHLADEIAVDENIVLRAKTAKNYDEFVEIATANQRHLADWLPWAINIPDESSFTHYEESAQKKQDDVEANWNIYFNDQLAGAIGLMNRDPNANVLEIGYWLTKDSTGKGIMSRSVAKLIEVAFEQTDTPLVEIACDEGNQASANVAIANGLHLVRTEQREAAALKETGVHQVRHITREQYLK